MSDKAKLKVAINELGGVQWTGGITYRNNLLKAIKLLDLQDNFVCLSSDPVNNGLDPSFKVVKILKPSGLFDKSLGSTLKKLFGFDYAIYKSLQKENVDILFPNSLSIGRHKAVMYWIPDFQFVHLPHLYTPAHIANNKIKLNKYFNDANLVIVSSEDALKDLKAYSPLHFHKARVMSFVAHVPDNLYEDDPRSVLSTYNLPEDFIYLPNQFWSHKNHITVFKALKLLKAEGIKPFIVCSGNPVDVRDPMHLAFLMQKISEFGIRDQVAFLGLVPHDHVYSLIRQSKCVLNPSLFEGWSTSVEEAKSVGKRMVLSDLRVHLEQNPAGSLFFNQHDVNDLAQKLKFAWLHFPSGPDLKLEEDARSKIGQRMKNFASRFMDLCTEAISIKTKSK